MKNQPIVFRRFSELKAADGGELTGVPSEIELLQTGHWNTPYHGTFTITNEDLEQYKQHFYDGVRRTPLPIDFEHITVGGAAAWINDLEIRANDRGGFSLWATNVEGTKRGNQLIADKEYRFFSPEFADRGYEDPERAGIFYDNVLVGGGFTNRPLFKNLRPVAANDDKRLTVDNQANIIYLNEENIMNLETLLAKKANELTDEEKAFIVEHKDELTEDQVKQMNDAGVLEAEGAETQGENQDDNDNDDANDDSNENQDNEETSTQPTQASDGTVAISASELQQLKADAAAGKQASEQLARKASEDHINSQIFSDTNKSGKLPLAAKNELVDFYHSLSAKQRQAFDGIVSKMPSIKMFGEVGDGGQSAMNSAADEVQQEAKKLIKQAKDNGEAVPSLGSAIGQVLKANADLKARYHAEKKENNS